MNNDQPKLDNNLHISLPNVGSIINSRLALPNSELNSNLSDYDTDYSWQGLLLIEDDYKKLNFPKPMEEAHPSQRFRVESLQASCSRTTPLLQPYNPHHAAIQPTSYSPRFPPPLPAPPPNTLPPSQ